MDTTSLKTAVASLIRELDSIPEGLHQFTYSPVTHLIQRQAAPGASPAPLLTLPATTEALERVLSAFSNWDDEVRIGALRCKGLPSDIWIF
ncbi:hypothetical protein [Stutzerimonas nitrititolerans]|uniref:hypothetical protein n=1 Tax=Stutzerimonas nitrititolerans TaxID=2482751 RepID=UPI0028A87DCA|nr:hypothetical protein [Stutzerimonas nitrititolerans]